jgi:hypothetical protein
MKAGSLINLMAIEANHPEVLPEIGTGVTFYSWTDRSAGTVTEIVDAKKMIIGIKPDRATRTDSNGMSDCQSYSYETIHDASPRYYRFSSKKKCWEGVSKNEKGRWVLNGSNKIGIGHRDAHHDYSF